MGNSLYLNSTSLVILAFLLLGLLLIGYAIFTKMTKKSSQKKYNKFGNKTSLGVCPVCATILEKNEQVKTATYTSNKDDNLCYIYGCQHCYPISDSETTRTCPVCKQKVNDGEPLIARHFIRNDGTERIHILGCNKCRFQK